jgi:hypothetical protein
VKGAFKDQQVKAIVMYVSGAKVAAVPNLRRKCACVGPLVAESRVEVRRAEGGGLASDGDGLACLGPTRGRVNDKVNDKVINK